MNLIENLGYASIGIVFVVAILIVIITLFEKKLKKVVIKTKNKRDLFYQAQFETIDKSNPKKTISGIDSVARNFFNEAFKINKKDYTTLKDYFKKEKNKNAEKFCDIMIKLSYSPEKNSSDIEQALKILGQIISNTHIQTKSELLQLNENKKPLREVQVSSINQKENQNKQ